MTVTPFVGVWIETSESVNNKICQWSHPSWVCGLKRLYGNHYNAALGSHPSWVCGLKLRTQRSNIKIMLVTPFVGVWIETYDGSTSKKVVTVTPFVGVWIET